MALRPRLLRARDGCEPPPQLLADDRVDAHRRRVARARRRRVCSCARASTTRRPAGKAASSSSCSCSPTSSQEQADAVGRELERQPRRQRGQVRRQAGGLRGVQAALPRLSRARRHRDARHPADLVPGGAAQTPTPTSIEAIGKQFKTKPGVMQVVFATDTVKPMQGTSADAAPASSGPRSCCSSRRSCSS